MNNPTVAQLREKLSELGINVPKGFSENVKNNRETVPPEFGKNIVTNQNNVVLQTLQTVTGWETSTYSVFPVIVTEIVIFSL